MATIHPKPQLVALRPDGDGGLELMVKATGDVTYVQPVDDVMLARWLRDLSAHLVGRLKGGAAS